MKREMESEFSLLASFLLDYVKLALYPSTEASLFLLYSSFLLGLNNCLILAFLWPQGSSSSVLTLPGFCTFLLVPLYPGHIFVNNSFVKSSLDCPNLRVHFFSS